MSKPLDFSQVKSYSVREKGLAFDPSRLCRVPDVHQSMDHFFACLPRTHKTHDLLEVAERIVLAAANHRTVLWMLGAPMLERGLSPLVIQLMHAGIVQHLALDGAAAVRDFELAYFGRIIEETPEDLREGMQGMARETGDWMNGIINEGARRGFGIGHALGRGILDRRAAYDEYSILAHAAGLRVPLTVHSAIGADAIHQHPSADGMMLGKGAYKDFQLFAGQVPEIAQGGILVNCYSPDFLPGCFLRALNLSRNLGYSVQNFTAVDLTLRAEIESAAGPFHQVTRDCGHAFAFQGHPELTFPLLFAAIQRLLR